jgi:hypothetical protein
MEKQINELDLKEIADLIDARYVHIEEAMGEGDSAERLAQRIREIATEYDWVRLDERMPTGKDADRSGRVWWGSSHSGRTDVWNLKAEGWFTHWRKIRKQIPLPQSEI